MQNMIQLSLFGDYEKYSTDNFDSYKKLIDFFGDKEYKPATINELQLQPNGQVRVIVMPEFLDETGTIIDISSNRINFQKNVDCEDIICESRIDELNQVFQNEFSDLLNLFLDEFSIKSNRIALNCGIIEKDTKHNILIQSDFFDDINKTEMLLKNATRKEIEKEETNITLEKYTTQGFIKYFYDINSLAENQVYRFSKNNIQKIFNEYINTAITIEKGLK